MGHILLEVSNVEGTQDIMQTGHMCLWGQSWDLLTRVGVPVGKTHFIFQEDTGSN